MHVVALRWIRRIKLVEHVQHVMIRITRIRSIVVGIFPVVAIYLLGLRSRRTAVAVISAAAACNAAARSRKCRVFCLSLSARMWNYCPHTMAYISSFFCILSM